MKWLVSAFEPFNGATSNSSLITLNELRHRDFSGQVSFHTPVPVTFGGAWQNLREVLERSPEIDGVLALGQAEGRARVSLECVALNWVDARTADNAGVIPPRGPIADGPELLWSQIPWEKFPDSPLSSRSYSAGTFVCNEIMFHSLEWGKRNSKLAGFVHIPLLEQQADACYRHLAKQDRRTIDEVERVLRFLISL